MRKNRSHYMQILTQSKSVTSSHLDYNQGSFKSSTSSSVTFKYKYDGWNKNLPMDTNQYWYADFLLDWMSVVLASMILGFGRSFSGELDYLSSYSGSVDDLASVIYYDYLAGVYTPRTDPWEVIEAALALFKTEGYLPDYLSEQSTMMIPFSYVQMRSQCDNFVSYLRQYKNIVDNTWGYDEDDEDVRKYKSVEINYIWNLQIIAEMVNETYLEFRGGMTKEYRSDNNPQSLLSLEQILKPMSLTSRSYRYTLNPEWDHD